VTVTETMAVTVAEFVIVAVGLHFYFRVAGRGKDRW
jgi:hypothetical protein